MVVSSSICKVDKMNYFEHDTSHYVLPLNILNLKVFSRSSNIRIRIKIQSHILRVFGLLLSTTLNIFTFFGFRVSLISWDLKQKPKRVIYNYPAVNSKTPFNISFLNWNGLRETSYSNLWSTGSRYENHSSFLRVYPYLERIHTIKRAIIKTSSLQ